MMDIAWLKEILELKSITHADIAAAIGRDRSVATRLINGEQQLKLSEIGPLSKLIGVPKAELIKRAGVDLDEPWADEPQPPSSGRGMTKDEMIAFARKAADTAARRLRARHKGMMEDKKLFMKIRDELQSMSYDLAVEVERRGGSSASFREGLPAVLDRASETFLFWDPSSSR